MLSAKGHTPGGKVRPSVMAFSRQGMPNLPGTSKEGVLKGGYIVHGGGAKPDVILLATGARTPDEAPLAGLCCAQTGGEVFHGGGAKHKAVLHATGA